ncbi:hypothetical protein [Thiomicrorhabdus sp.]|uniref:hypothetical protein n=1 Tax=Thiomicrorhabdus sp. TaxID=2039724 RepID=UPI002AA5F6B2|nr:hypothetical protein [Thiomicrorhabdus sp.]
MSEEHKAKSRFNLIVLLLSIMGVIFSLSGYIIGNAFYQGSLSAYGVSSISFEPSTEELYLHAFYYLSFVWIDVIRYIADLVRMAERENLLNWFVFMFIGLVVLLAFIFVIFRIKPRYKEILKSLIKKVEKLYLFLYAELKNTAFSMVVFVGPILFMATWVLVPSDAYKRGGKQADITITEFLEKGCFTKEGERWSNCKVLKDFSGNVIYKGVFVAQSKDKVAFMTKEGSFVTEIPKGAVIENKIFTQPYLKSVKD